MRTLEVIVAGLGTSWIAVADAVAKATILFLIAGLAAFLLRHRSAALRHMIWTLALIAVLVLPALSIVLPRWQLNVVTIESASSFQFPASSFQFPVSGSQFPVANSQLPVSSSEFPAPSSFVVRTPGLARASRQPATTTVASLSSILFAVWAIGALLIVGRLVAGVLAVQWMSRRT